MRLLENLQAEADTLSVLVRKPEILFRHEPMLKEGVFTNEIHRRIFRFAMDQYQEGNSILVPSLFSPDPQDQSIFTEIMGRSAPVESYPKLVRVLFDTNSLRELRIIGDNIVFEVDNGVEESSTLLEKYGSDLTSLQVDSEADSIGDVKDDLTQLYNRIEENRDAIQKGIEREAKGPITNTSLDNCIIGGLEPNDLMIIAATPSTGKTELALQIAVENLRRGLPAAIFSLEMNKQQLFTRMLAHVSNTPMIKLKTGEGLSADDMKHIQSHIEAMKKWKLFVDDSQSTKLSEILAKSKKLKFLEKQLGLIIVDYVGLVENDIEKRGSSKNDRVGGVARSLKILAGQINTPVILLSQLNRGVDTREGNNEPRLSDLRDSGELEAHTDIVMFLYTTLEDRKQPQPETQIYIGKNRNNPLGGIIAKNDKNVQTFREIRASID